MAYLEKTIASAGTLTTVKTQKPGKGLTVSVTQVGQGGQCDCDAGIAWVYGQAQPCHLCRDGQRMAECQQASDYMEIYG